MYAVFQFPPRRVTQYCVFQTDLMVVASDLPGMDFVTMSVIHEHHVSRSFDSMARIHVLTHDQVHFAVRDDDHSGLRKGPKVAIRAERKDTDDSNSFALISWAEPRTIRFPWRVRGDVGSSLSEDHKRVVIRAEHRNTSDTFELVPREKLKVHLPSSLIQGYVHWLNLSTFNIEIRPIEEPWKQSSDNWLITLRSGQSCIIKGSESLMDKRSPTWAMVSSRLQCLDDPENFIITVSPLDTTRSPPLLQLSVILPRYDLSFFVNDTGDLESRDFKDMVYDEDQCIGTLFGLVNRLVLRPKTQREADLIPKRIIIPHSNTLNQRGHNVHVKLPSCGPIRHYTYQVDSELGCLKGFVDIGSRLYLARLHSLTGSGCRPDPLTGRVGIEEAFSLIWLAGARQEIPGWTSCSPQIRLAFARIQNNTNRGLDPLAESALLREAHLFPTEVATIVRPCRQEPLVSLEQLLHERPPPTLLALTERLPRYSPERHAPNINSLPELFSSLRTNQSAPAFQSQYIARLFSSAVHIQTTDSTGITFPSDSRKPDTGTLCKHYRQCRIKYEEYLDKIKGALSPETEFERILHQCGHWPRVTPFILFRCLASTSPVKLLEKWKECLISLVLLALDVQRARRLLQFALHDLEEELHKELQNEGCNGWDAEEHPDWLLIQVCLL